MSDYKVFKADKDGRTRGNALGVEDLTGPVGEAIKLDVETNGVSERTIQVGDRHYLIVPTVKPESDNTAA